MIMSKNINLFKHSSNFSDAYTFKDPSNELIKNSFNEEK
ncbi:hypothetical protein EV05_0015 [Prochlorococcus sp. MIT 0601]|nr:hypothetical protein EV05_0015 [Prochlorococcus sp. MIT 0601]